MSVRPRGVAFLRRHLGLVVLALTFTFGCAKDPTEVLLTVGVDTTVTQQITSLLVTLSWPTGTTSRVYQSLGAPAADADIPQFYFPALLDILLTADGVSGETQILVEGSDPTISDTVLANGTVTVPVASDKTTTTSVVLTAVPPPPTDDAGTADGG